MIIKIKNDTELGRLINSLADELVTAAIHFKLFKDLQKNEYSREYSQSPAFWQYTFKAHLDSVLFCLCRVYDKHSKALSLYNLLDTIKANVHFFNKEHFINRKKDNQFVDSLAREDRIPKKEQLEEDMRYINSKNPLVEKLIRWRNELIAHKNAAHVIKEIKLEKTHPFLFVEIEELLSHGMEIINRYNYLFEATTHSTQIVGHDDYEFVLDSIRFKLETQDEERDGLRKRIKGRP